MKTTKSVSNAIPATISKRVLDQNAPLAKKLLEAKAADETPETKVKKVSTPAKKVSAPKIKAMTRIDSVIKVLKGVKTISPDDLSVKANQVYMKAGLSDNIKESKWAVTHVRQTLVALVAEGMLENNPIDK